MEMQFREWHCHVAFGKYRNDRVAIALDDDEGPVATLTKNVPEADTFKNEVIIDTNNYPDAIESLVRAGITSMPVRYVQAGFCTYPVCTLLKTE